MSPFSVLYVWISPFCVWSPSQIQSVSANRRLFVASTACKISCCACLHVHMCMCACAHVCVRVWEVAAVCSWPQLHAISPAYAYVYICRVYVILCRVLACVYVCVCLCVCERERERRLFIRALNFMQNVLFVHMCIYARYMCKCVYVCVRVYAFVRTCVCVRERVWAQAAVCLRPWLHAISPIGWLRLVGSIKLQVSFAEYGLFYRAPLQKRPVILSILLTEATP